MTTAKMLELADVIDDADVIFIRNCPMLTKFDHENVDTLLSGEEQNLIVTALCASAPGAEWQPIERAPVAEPYEDPDLVMLWVSDGGHGGKGTVAFGRCYRSH